jgi:hypothetical protein
LLIVGIAVALILIFLSIVLLRRLVRKEVQQKQGEGFDIDSEGNVFEKEENEDVDTAKRKKELYEEYLKK